MTLRLRIVSDQRRLLGDRSSITFTVDGGNIGRSADNDWVLPDPLRYVSAHHARVEYRDGQFFLEDLSTNGVFVNDDERPLAKAKPMGHPLTTGDIIRMGDYHIVASVDAQAEQLVQGRYRCRASPDEHSWIADPRPRQRADRHRGDAESRRSARPGVAASARRSIPSTLTVRRSRRYPCPRRTRHSAPAAPLAAGAAPAPAARDAAPTLTPEEEAIERRIARLAKAAARDPKNGASPAALYDVHSGLQAFCRGAGVEVERLPPDAQTRLLHLAGQLFREALVGLKDLDRSRNDTRNRFRIELHGRTGRSAPVAGAHGRRGPGHRPVRKARELAGWTPWVGCARPSPKARLTSWRLRKPLGGVCGIPGSAGPGRARSPLRTRCPPRESPLGRQGAVLGAVHNLLPESHRDAGGSFAPHVRGGIRRGVQRVRQKTSAIALFYYNFTFTPTDQLSGGP